MHRAYWTIPLQLNLLNPNHGSLVTSHESRIQFLNLLVHDYLGVDAERVWKIIEIELPTLKQTITTMLRDYTKWQAYCLLPSVPSPINPFTHSPINLFTDSPIFMPRAQSRGVPLCLPACSIFHRWDPSVRWVIIAFNLCGLRVLCG